MPLHGTLQFAINHRGVKRVGHTFFPKLPLPLRGSSPPRNTLFLWPSPLHLDRFGRFCMGPKCYAVQCTVNGEENPQNCPFRLGFRHHARRGPSHGHRQHAQKFGKDRAFGSEDILADTHTHTHTQRQTYLSQYFATAPAGELIR